VLHTTGAHTTKEIAMKRIATAVSVGVVPRAGTDVASLPDPLPRSVVLADHRAGDDSLFIYPWC